MPVHHPIVASPTLRQRRRAAANNPAVLRSVPMAAALVGSDESALPCLPRLPDQLIARPRLQQRLDTWAPITVVHGLPGSGKTTLIASWLAANLATVTPLWISASATEDTGAERFDRELSAALDVLESIYPSEVGELFDLFNTARRTPKQRLGDLLRTSSVGPDGRDVVLVIDDASQCSSTDIWPGLAALLQRHRRFYLVLACSGISPVQDLGLAVAMNVITGNDLMLDRQETAAMAASAGRTLSAAELTDLHAASSGWAAVVRMTLAGPSPTSDGGCAATAARYLRRVVLAAVGEGTGASDVLRFSLPDYVDVQLIGDLHGRSNVDAVVGVLTRSGLVERRRSGPVEELSYPTMVRDVLRNEYVDRDPEAAGRFHAQLAAWFARQDAPMHAIHALRHAVECGDWSLAVRMWAERGLTIAATDSRRLRAILREIPREVRQLHPALKAFIDSPAAIGGELRLPLREGLPGRLPGADRLALNAGHLIGLRNQGRYDEAARFADREAGELGASQAVSLLPERLAWYELQAATAAALVDSLDEARRRYQLAHDHAVAADARFIAAQAAASLAVVYAVDGQTDQAWRWLARYPVEADPSSHVAAAFLALDRLDTAALEAALANLEEAASDYELWPYLAYLRCQHALQYGDPLTMLNTLTATQRRHEHPSGSHQGAARPLLARARADLLIALGQGQRAQSVIAAFGDDPPARLGVAQARLCLLSGDPEQARLIATRAVFDELTTPADQLELLVIHAVAALRAGDVADARQQFEWAVCGQQTSGNLRAFAMLADVDLKALGELVDDRRLYEAVRARVSRAGVCAGEVTLVSLTRSERELLDALGRTGSRREIAEARHVSLNTVKTQLRGLYQKFETTSRDETLARARELGVL